MEAAVTVEYMKRLFECIRFLEMKGVGGISWTKKHRPLDVATKTTRQTSLRSTCRRIPAPELLMEPKHKEDLHVFGDPQDLFKQHFLITNDVIVPTPTWSKNPTTDNNEMRVMK
jgi:hypothetical protein